MYFKFKKRVLILTPKVAFTKNSVSLLEQVCFFFSNRQICTEKMTAIIDRMPTIRPTYRCDSEFDEAVTDKKKIQIADSPKYQEKFSFF